MTKVLVADIPQVHDELTRCFPGADVHCVSTFPGARRALALERYDAVVIGFHFEGGRMCELVAHVRRLAGYAGVPVLCVRTHPAALDPRFRNSVQRAVQALGATRFLDVSELEPDALCRHPGEAPALRRA